MNLLHPTVNIERRLSLLLVAIFVTLGLFAASRYSYLLFHALAEGFSIIIAGAMFVLVWNTWSLTEHGYLKFLGIAFLSVGGLDLVHTMAYKGMNIFPGYDANLPTQLWIAARYVQAVSLLVAPKFRHRKLRRKDRYLIAGFYVVITTALLVLIFARLFPDCYLEGQGLTPFKVVSEYIISVLLLIAGLHLYHRRDDFTADIFPWLVAAIVFTILSELAFTFYVSVYGVSNLIGHIFKIWAFYCLYRAIIETGLRKPYALLFNDLKQRNVQLAEEVAERKRAEMALRESDANYKALLKNIQAGVIVHQADAQVIACNLKAQELLGLTEDQILGKDVADPVWQFLSEDGTPMSVDDYPVNQVLTTGQPIRGLVVGSPRPDKNDLIWSTVSADPIDDAEGDIKEVIVSFMDITDRKRVEEELRQYRDHLEELVEQRTEALTEAQQRLAEQERLAALGQFAGGIAHDLRQPLSVITNVGYFLKLYLSDPDDKVVEYLNMLEEEVDYANRIIHDLLEFARTGQVRVKPVAISNLVTSVIEKHPPPEQVTIELELADQLPQVYADPSHIHQVLANLVTNAYQAMPRGGTLTISVSVDPVELEIDVTDTGTGISPDNLEKIFEPLFTTKQKGVGLGLAISKKLVEANGGQLRVKSQPQKGTTFTLSLPLRKDSHEEPI